MRFDEFMIQAEPSYREVSSSTLQEKHHQPFLLRLDVIDYRRQRIFFSEPLSSLRYIHNLQLIAC